MHPFTSTASELFIIKQTRSMSLCKNKINLLSCPKGPVVLIWCSSRTDPNIMHFPSPENLYFAQQTDKYLIGLPSVPSPSHGSRYSGHESYHRIWVPCQSLGIKAHVGTKSAPAHLRTPLQLVLAAPVCLATSTAQMPGHNRWINTKTQNNYKGLLPFPW